MHHLTIRNIPQDVGEALKAEKDRRRQSLDQTVIQLLRESLSGNRGLKRSNGLAQLAGSWTQEEHERFKAVVASVDQELWK